MTDDVEFMLLACDGIWDVMTNQEVVNFIRARIVHGMEPEAVSISFTTFCIIFCLSKDVVYDLNSQLKLKSYKERKDN